MTEVSAGQACVAQFTQDNKWYRAQIHNRDEDNNTVEVYYVDYGNRETLPESQLRRLLPQRSFMSLPTQAVTCALSGVRPVSDIWHEGNHYNCNH